MSLSAFPLVLWQRGSDLLEEGAGTLWQFGTLSIIKILGLLYFLAYFSAQNPNGVSSVNLRNYLGFRPAKIFSDSVHPWIKTSASKLKKPNMSKFSVSFEGTSIK